MSCKHDIEKRKLIREIVIYCRMLKKYAEKNKINLNKIWIVEGR